MIRHKLISTAKSVTTLFLASACMASAQQYISVSSTTDGHGLFSYTLDLGPSPYVWGMSPDNGGIFLQSHGILQVVSPPGWTASVDASDYISWQPTSGIVYVGQPSLTFSVLSSYTDSVVYDQWGISDPVYSKGLIGGTLFTVPDHQGIALGYETFSFLGPQVVPEPSPFALIGFFVVLVNPARRFLRACGTEMK